MASTEEVKPRQVLSKKQTKKSTRRGKGGDKRKNKQLKFMGANAAGISNKRDSLLNIIEGEKPNVLQI